MRRPSPEIVALLLYALRRARKEDLKSYEKLRQKFNRVDPSCGPAQRLRLYRDAEATAKSLARAGQCPECKGHKTVTLMTLPRRDSPPTIPCPTCDGSGTHTSKETS